MRGQAGLEAVAAEIDRALEGDALGGAARLEAAIEAVEEALIETSAGEPTLLLVDDAQWADEGTLALLAMITERATRKAQGKLLVLAAVRDEPGGPAALSRFIEYVRGHDEAWFATREEIARHWLANAPAP